MADPLETIAANTRTDVYDAIQRLSDHKSAPAGCPVQNVKARLQRAGLRPTRQRMLLGWLLFGRGHRHVSAEDLYAEANRARAHLSLATVYNTLRQFSEADLIRQVPTAGGRAYFDTNTGEHHHYLAEGSEEIWDAPPGSVALTGEAAAPPGFEVVGVDVIVRVRRIEPTA
jgi:Fur family iron response transcriptional regulator